MPSKGLHVTKLFEVFLTMHVEIFRFQTWEQLLMSVYFLYTVLCIWSIILGAVVLICEFLLWHLHTALTGCLEALKHLGLLSHARYLRFRLLLSNFKFVLDLWLVIRYDIISACEKAAVTSCYKWKIVLLPLTLLTCHLDIPIRLVGNWRHGHRYRSTRVTRRRIRKPQSRVLKDMEASEFGETIQLKKAMKDEGADCVLL